MRESERERERERERRERGRTKKVQGFLSSQFFFEKLLIGVDREEPIL